MTFFSDADGNSQIKVFGILFCAPPHVGHEPDRYYLWDFESTNVFSLLPNKIVSMEPTEETFNSGNFISPEGNLAENKARQYNNGSTMDLARHLVNKIRETRLSERKETVEEGGNTASQNVDTEQKN